VLDEPSIGLHARDVARLLGVLRGIRDRGNTVVVVEHAPEIVGAADHLIDLGPGAGSHGGRLVAEGTVTDVRRHATSLTARALRGELGVARRPGRRRAARAAASAPARNLRRPSSSPQPARRRHRRLRRREVTSCARCSSAGRQPERGACDHIEVAESRRRCSWSRRRRDNPALNPATVSKAFEGIRRRFAATREARALGVGPGWFSFNVPGGRCEKCEGSGETVIDMQFLEDVRVPCEACGGTRYRDEARRVRLGGRSIVEVLELTLEEALATFAEDRAIADRLEPFLRVGLGYLTLAQPLAALSGGELQRMRLALALAERKPGCLYVLDEPTTGLHPAEVDLLVRTLDGLLETAAGVIVVEHNLQLIRQADHVVDLGPEGGPGGGLVVVQGTPEAVAACQASHTGRALRAAGEESMNV
jgi:excinuclease ABC subunit A